MKAKKLTRSLIAALSAFLLVSCFACTPPEFAKANLSPVYESPYNWSQLVYKNGRFSYMKGWIPASLAGIDVSEFQGQINWYAVAADGIDFAIIRLGYRGYTEGSLFLDAWFYRNIEGARNAGIKIGVYLFSQAINEQEALEEAQMVIQALENIPLEYPVFFDFEPVADPRGRANDISDEQLTRNAQVFCEHIEANSYMPMLYGNAGDVGRMDSWLRNRYGVWFAQYGVAVPTAQFDFLIWQYSSNGVVSGIDGRVDMNIHFLYP